MDPTTDKPQARGEWVINARRYPKVHYVRWKQIKSLLLYITYIIGERIPPKETVAEVDKISKIACQ